MKNLWTDLRFSARGLLKSPGFTFIAVATLALGIGANTAIFSVVNGVLLRSLPYRNPDELVLLKNAFAGILRPGAETRSDSDALVWRDQTKSFEQIAAFGSYDGGVNLTDAHGSERVQGIDVSSNFFTTLGVTPVLGRLFSDEQERAEFRQTAIISERLWQSRYGSSAEVIGTEIQLNATPFTIIGVATDSVQYPRVSDIWVPLPRTFSERIFTSPNVGFAIFGRLHANATMEQARAEMTLLSAQVKMRKAIEIEPLLASLTTEIRPALLILQAVVGFVLLIACVNVASLLLSRGIARRRETAIRTALGAGRWRIIRHSLIEGVSIAIIGGLAGLLLANWLRDLLVALVPPDLPRLDDIVLDQRVLAFNAVLAIATGLLVGVLPAIQATRVDVLEAFHEGRREGKSRWLGFGLRGTLVVCEIALSLLPLIGAGLLVRSFNKVINVETGFERQQVLTVSVGLPPSRYKTREDRVEFFQKLIARVNDIPGVVAAGATNKLPLSKENAFSLLFEVVGRPQPPKFDERFATFLSVTPEYFRAMGIPQLQGRAFTERDEIKAAPVVIVNARMAAQLFPAGDAVGQRIKLPGQDEPLEIVGVVGSIRSSDLEKEPEKDMYLSYLQRGNPPTALAIRTVGDPLAIAGAVRETVKSLDVDLPVYDVKTIETRVSDAVARRRFIATLMSAFAVLALMLSAVGVYGVMAFAVTRRTREIGVRLALGAQRTHILTLVVAQGSRLIAVGVVVGVLAALALSRLMAGLLFGVQPVDFVTFAAGVALTASIALVACYLPARRATRVEPMVALRYE